MSAADLTAPHGSGWTDAHCHLHMSGRRDDAPPPEEQVATARAAGVARMVTVGCDVADSQAAIDVAAAFDDVWATAGVHPHDAKAGIEGLEALLAAPEVVAVGECGLDYHYDHSPREVQREVFAVQIALAKAHDLPLVIHSRSAWDDTFDVLAGEGAPERLVFHCFTGGADEARRCLDVGAFVSISGIVTFKTAGDVREAVGIVPADHLMVETDAPFLAPVPHRGKTNQAAWVPLVGAFVAEVQGRPVPEVMATTSAAAAAFYGLPPLP